MRSLGRWVRLSLVLTLLVIWTFVEFDLFHHDWVYILSVYPVCVGGVLWAQYLVRRRQRRRQQPTAAQQHPEVKEQDASGPTTRIWPPAARAARPGPRRSGKPGRRLARDAPEATRPRQACATGKPARKSNPQRVGVDAYE
jgi:hypothetical protein